MSAIAGLLRFDARPVRRQDLERAANALRPYGPDRSGIVTTATIGLVHVLMRMTPDDFFDSQPLRGGTGALIAADLRLDNRDDVLARIGLRPTEAAAWADSRVLLAAWERLGDRIWPLLRGPFAAAIWDPRSRTLTLARDHLGLNVVMWHRADRFFAFATMPKGLFALGEVPRELNEEKFADCLVLNHADHSTTVYRNILRVPPAHLVKVSGDGLVEAQRYWSAAEIGAVRQTSDQAYADGLRECLDRAVRRQMRSAHPVGCLLTGGLDSSSVSVLAARALAEKNQRLAAFTAVPRCGFDAPVPAGAYADETPYVEAVARAAGNIDINYAREEAHNGVAELERFFLALEGPVRNPTTLGSILAILRLARAQGRRVLLGGLYGNYTISWNGWSQAAVHLRQGRLLTAYRQWQLYYRRTPYTRRAAAQRLLIDPLLWKRSAMRASGRGSASIAPWQKHSAIRPDFAAAMRVDERARQFGHDFHYRLHDDERLAGLTPVDYVGDWNAAEKAVTGVEIRDPTADMDVVTYCLGVPAEQYLVEGIDRSLIRRAMWGLLPQAVLANGLTGMHAADWYEKLELQRDELARQVAQFSESSLVRRMIDVERLDRAVKNWPTGGRDLKILQDQISQDRIFQEYGLALSRGVAGGRFLRWFEATNQ